MLDQTSPESWLVRAGEGSPPEAIVDAFARGFRLTSWSLVESERIGLGVYLSADLAETAWWRHLDSRGGA